MKDKRYFISIIEEYWDGQVINHVGRVEVYVDDEEYAIEEIRFATNDTDSWYTFSEKWDYKRITETELKYIKKQITDRFMDV